MYLGNLVSCFKFMINNSVDRSFGVIHNYKKILMVIVNIKYR